MSVQLRDVVRSTTGRFFFALALLLCLRSNAIAQTISLGATSYSRASLSELGFEERIRKSGSLGGGAGSCCITGTVEYAFRAPSAGWYELITTGTAAGVEFILTPEGGSGNDDKVFTFEGGTALAGNEDKVGMVWLDAGAYRLRLRRDYWTGFPQITAIHLRPGSGSLMHSLNVSATGGRVARIGECRPLRLRYGPLAEDTLVDLLQRDRFGERPRVTAARLPATPVFSAISVPVPCDREGSFLLSFGHRGHEFSWRESRLFEYEVYSNAARTANLYSLKRKLVAEIDAAVTPPDFWGGGTTRVVPFPEGAYRESGDTGFTPFQRSPAALRLTMRDPSWFAYTLSGLLPQKPYVVEVEYPDDKLRTFGVQMRETLPLEYPVSIAIDTGGEYSTSGRVARREFVYWPRTSDPRITFSTAHDGRRAAVSKIRVFELAESTGTPQKVSGSATRQFVHWYEEGTNFLSLFGAPGTDARSQRVAIERWFDLLLSENATTVMPTVLIYSFALYPSRINVAFSGGAESDTLRRMLLIAEPRGLKVVPEFHPRGDELVRGVSDPTHRQRYLLSKDGNQAFFNPDGKTRRIPPYFNPLDPEIADWYVSMIGEMTDQYADSKALSGVSLRVMQWFNGAFNNLVSIDWGYDASTASAFQASSGLTFPVEGRPEAGNSRAAAQARFRWLTSDPARKAAWLEWRAGRITHLVERIRDRVRKSRPDLLVHLNFFDAGPSNADVRQGLLERGLDVDALSRVEGVRLINNLHGYGRREKDAQSTMVDRERLLDPSILNVFRSSGQPGYFITSARYLEVTEAVTPPILLGMPKETRMTWASLAANPAETAILERLAIPLAEADAQMLGDGGNQYVFGNPSLREFVREFRHVPAAPFVPYPSARDPVALWTLGRQDAFHFYVVNREPFPTNITLTLSSASRLVRPSDGSELRLGAGRRMVIDLPPYGIRYFRAEPTARIESASISIPPREQQRTKALAAWVSGQADRTAARWLALSSEERKLLDQLRSEVTLAASRNETWRTRTLFERSALLPLYRSLGEQPPGWTDR